MYTKILSPNMAPCQTPRLKYGQYLANVAALKFSSLNNSAKRNDFSWRIGTHTIITRAFIG